MMLRFRLLTLLVMASSLCVVKAQMENYFDEWRFQDSVNRAMQAVTQILDTTRNPRLLEDEDHVYEDKYTLTEFLTNTVLAAEMNALGALGVTNDVFDLMHKTVHQDKRSVTLRFRAEQTTRFVKEEEVKVVAHESETEELEITEDGGASSFWGGSGEKSKTVKTKILETVLQRHWQVGLNTQLTLFFGTDNDNPMVLQTRNASRTYMTSGGTNIKTSGGATERPPDKTKMFDADINLTWLIQMLSKDKTSQFVIDRFSEEAKKKCRTPRRNPNIEDAFKFLVNIRGWAVRVISFFNTEVNQLESDTTTQLQRFHSFMRDNHNLAQSLFLPTLPVLENSTLLSGMDLGQLLKEQARRIEEVNGHLESSLSDNESNTLISSVEGNIIVMCHHIDHLWTQYLDSVNYIEHLLRKQLIRAIGKEVTAADFEGFMESHYRKLFSAAYAPQLFSYAVRRPNHYPDGTLSIEAPSPKEATKNEPVQTFVNHIPKNASSPPIFIPINAATSIEIKGDRYLHGWLQHRFDMSAQRKDKFRLAARAHQFSNFLLVVGTMAGPDKFKPSSAIILQNKDEVLIPLITEVIPSAKEFKDAISSLSPEQQAFAKAFRAMQLESSLFGVCVIQLKPQLETLLGLPAHSLTKEIKLTQNLMQLFVDYQIPSDLLSVSHELSNGNTTDKLNSVKENVKAVMDVIDQAKEEQLLEEKRKADMRENMHHSTTTSWSPSASPNESPSESPSSAPSGSPTCAPAGASVERSSRRSLRTSSIERAEQKGDFSKLATFNAFTMSTSQEEAEQKTEKTESKTTSTSGTPPSPVAGDFTLIPKTLDSQIEKHDQDGSLRSTIVKADSRWIRARKVNLLTPSQSESMMPNAIELEQKKAFDLLDALSRSGSLPIEQSELHIVVVLSHCFEDDIMSTIIKDNINPIEKVEKSSLLIASTIHGQAASELIGDSATLERLTNTFPGVIDATSD